MDMMNRYFESEKLFIDSLWSETTESDSEKHIFSEEYQNKKQRILKGQLKGNGLVKDNIMNKPGRYKVIKAAVVFLAFFCLIPASMVVAECVKRYVARKTELGKYGESFTFENPENHRIIHVKVVCDFPQKYEQVDNNGIGKWWKTSDNQYIHADLLYARSMTEITVTDILESKEIMVGDNPAYQYKLNVFPGKSNIEKFDKLILILFDELGYAVKLYGSETIPMNELMELAAQIKLVETNYENADEVSFEMNIKELLDKEESSEETEEKPIMLDGNLEVPLAAGEIFETKLKKVTDREIVKIQGKIISVNYPEKWNVQGGIVSYYFDESIIDTDGKLKDCYHTYYVVGDGVNTLSGEYLGSEQKKQKLIEVKLEFKNPFEDETAFYFSPAIRLYSDSVKKHPFSPTTNYYDENENCVNLHWLWNDNLIDEGYYYIMTIPGNGSVTTTFIFGVEDDMEDIRLKF